MKRFHFWLGAAAILFAYVWLAHLLFLQILPDPFFESDSPDYLHGVLAHLQGGDFSIPPIRGLGYPFFLAVALRLANGFQAVLIAQHFFCRRAFSPGLSAAEYHGLLVIFLGGASAACGRGGA